MLIGLIGENCSGKSTLANNIKKHFGAEVITGDGVKQSKEAVHMPGVKKMAQESETCSKPDFIHGHMFGAIGVVISNSFKKFCLPLKINIQEGLKTMATWKETQGIIDISDKSHVKQMIESGFEVAKLSSHQTN